MKRSEHAAMQKATRVLLSVILVLTLSFSTVFAETDAAASDQTTGQGTETVEQATDNAGTGQTDSAASGQDQAASTESGQTDSAETTVTPAPAAKPAPKPVSHIIKKGKNYYYRYSNGKIRKKKGFVTDLGHRYYIKKGGKIVRGKTFKVKKKKYRAYSNGVIATGVYKWNRKWNYSDSNGVWIKTEKLVSWKGSTYYVQKGGVVLMNSPFSYKNIPYVADASGRVTRIAVPDGGGNPVVAIAKKQVGIMTGKTYWTWYFKTKFINSDRTPWCGTFVAWCYNAAGWYDKISVARKFGNLGYVPSYSKYATSAGKWIKTAAANPGDVIIFGKYNAHVGLVEGVVGDYIITIEGNAGPTAAWGLGKPGAVVRKIYRVNASNIKGVIRVD